MPSWKGLDLLFCFVLLLILVQNISKKKMEGVDILEREKGRILVNKECKADDSSSLESL